MNFHIKLISKETISELFFASLFLMSKLEREIERKIDRERDIISAFSYADENVEHERDFTPFCLFYFWPSYNFPRHCPNKIKVLSYDSFAPSYVNYKKQTNFM